MPGAIGRLSARYRQYFDFRIRVKLSPLTPHDAAGLHAGYFISRLSRRCLSILYTEYHHTFNNFGRISMAYFILYIYAFAFSIRLAGVYYRHFKAPRALAIDSTRR